MASPEHMSTTAPERSNVLSLRQRRILTHTVIFLSLLALWELGSRIGWLDPLFFPRPSAILHSFYLIYIKNGNIWYHLYVTLGLVAMGWVAGSLLGVGLGALVGFNPIVRQFLKPYVIVLEATPRIAVAPLLIAALGFGVNSKVAIIMLVCFFAPFINTLSGVINVDAERLELFRSMRASKMQVLRKLVLPDAIPIIMAGERLALTAALSGALVAEFIQRDKGIGSLILTYTRNLNMASAFACILWKRPTTSLLTGRTKPAVTASVKNVTVNGRPSCKARIMSDTSASSTTQVVRTLLPHLMLFAVLIGLWELAVATGLITSIMIPKPSAIAAAIWELYVTKGTIYRHFFITLTESCVGFAIGAGIAISLAVCSSLSDAFRRYVSPYAVVLNVTPGIALTPVVIAWFGYGIGSKIALAAIISFFPIFVNTLTGLVQVDEDREELFRSMGANRLQIFRNLRVPAALPLLFAGLKIGLTTALIGAVVAEFAQATEGVGVLMSRFSFQLNMAASIATLLSMTLIGLLLFYSMEFLDDRIVFWRRESRMSAASRARAKAWKNKLDE